MKLTLKRDDEQEPIKITTRIGDDTNFDELLDIFCGLAITYGYSQELINRVIAEKAQELDTNS